MQARAGGGLADSELGGVIDGVAIHVWVVGGCGDSESYMNVSEWADISKRMTYRMVVAASRLVLTTEVLGVKKGTRS